MFCNLRRFSISAWPCFLSLVFVILASSNVQAQQTSVKYGNEFGGYIGTWLPNQIDGVTEILPAWGLRYAVPISGAVVEGGLRRSHAKGVDFDLVHLDLRFDMNTVEGFTNVFYIGYDLNSYIPLNYPERTWKGGVHAGSGLMMHVASSFWLRTDLSLAVSPGTSLYLGVGFVIRSPGSSN